MAENEKVVFERPATLADKTTHYCPGCHHGTVHRLVAEALEDLGVVERSICIGSIGCSVFIYNYIQVDSVEAPHGRAPAVGTGVKRGRPDKIVFTYQGDGDLASIGLAEIMHAANRGERITTVFVNNTIYGMTGGQMAPTTLVGQKTTTSPMGRREDKEGSPMRMAELISNLEGVAYSSRVSLDSIKNINQAKKAMKKAFQVQIDDLGYGFVELLATCPTGWKMDPVQSNQRLVDEVIPYFPLGIYKDVTATKGA